MILGTAYITQDSSTLYYVVIMNSPRVAVSLWLGQPQTLAVVSRQTGLARRDVGSVCGVVEGALGTGVLVEALSLHGTVVARLARIARQVAHWAQSVVAVVACTHSKTR
jgi:hypothetical protein